MGKLIDNFKDFLDKTTEILNNKAEEIESKSKHYVFDYETEVSNYMGYPSGENVTSEPLRTYPDGCDCNTKEEERDPIALDVFGNYIYLGDKVRDVDYNDKRQNYISIKSSNQPYEFICIDGNIWRKVILESAFSEKTRSGEVSYCEKTGFFHVARES